MKKTLITLLALAGVACGDGTSEFYVPTGGNYYAGDYSFVFTINTDDIILEDGVITGLTGGNVLAVYGNYSGEEYQTNAFIFNVQGGAITLSAGRGSLSGIANRTAPITSSTSYVFGDESSAPDFATSDYELTVGTTYTIINKTVVSGTNGMQNIYIYADDFTTPLDTITYKGNMTGGNENSVIATWGNAAYDVVPEPATATLSLLALAGLAARRRRK